MTRVGRRFHGREPSERPRRTPHRTRRRALAGLVGGVVSVGVVAGCGGGPDASVGIGRADGAVVVRAKACAEGGIEQIDVVDPTTPGEPVWSAVASSPATARRAVPVAASVEGYRVADRRPEGTLPDRRLRVLVEGPDGESWGGPRFSPADLQEGLLRVAGQDVALAEWEAEPARCPDVGLAATLVGGATTAVAAALLWLAVRTAARALRRAD